MEKHNGGTCFLKQGAVRRVGNGISVDILRDPWLPHGSHPYVQTQHEALTNKTVDVLMVPNENQWDEDLIQDIFMERDIELILSIPLRNSDVDSWYWREEKLSLYTVKSAYRMLQNAKLSNEPNTDTGIWKKMWNLKLPLKTKNFM